MKKHIIFFLVALLGFLTSLSMQAQTLLQENFDGMTAGSAPPVSGQITYVSGNNANRQILVVDGSTSPADPFGGSGNQSLMIEKTGAGTGTIPEINFSFSETNVGILTFDLYLYQSSPSFDTPTLSLYLYDGSDIGVLTAFTANGTLVATPSGNKSVSGTPSLNLAIPIKIEFFTNQTYNVTVNGTLLNFPGVGTNVPYYTNTATSFDKLRIGTVEANRTESRFFVDNVLLVVPEPSTMTFLGLVGMAGLFLRRRNRRSA